MNVNLGKVAITPVGEWNPQRKYEKLDVVSYQGSSYIATTTEVPIGTSLTTSDYWQEFAAKGDTGSVEEWGNLGGKVTDQDDLIKAIEATVGKGNEAVTNHVEGSIVNFNTKAKDSFLKNLKINIEPVQDLHGQANPYPAGGGINMLAPTNASYDDNGIKITNDGNGKYTISGTASATVSYYVALSKNLVFPNKNVYLHIRNSSVNSRVVIVLNDSGNNQLVTCNASANTNKVSNAVNLNGQTATKLQFYIASGTTVSMTVEPMVLDTNTVTSFAPYSNICPISGWSTCNVWDDPKYGGTIQWNQLLKVGSDNKGVTVSFNSTTGLYTLGGTSDGSYAIIFSPFSAIKNHIYMSITDVVTNPNNVSFVVTATNINWSSNKNVCIAFETRTTNCGITNLTANTNMSGITFYSKILDLTSIFGDAEATRIYNMENSTAGSGVAYVKSLFPYNYYPYDDSYTKTCVSAVNGDTYRHIMLDLNGIRYGGMIDVLTGEMIVNRAYYSFTGNETFANYSTVAVCAVTLPVGKTVQETDIISSHATNTSIYFSNASKNHLGFIKAKFGVADADELKTYLQNQVTAGTPVQVSYELATPITVQLSPSNLSTFFGNNYIWADTGDISLDYIVDTKEMLDTRAPAITKFVEGNIVSFNDGADDQSLESLTIGIEPQQNLHGQANPWPAGGGANIWDEQWELGGIDNDTGLPDGTTQTWRSKNYTPVTPDATYYLYNGNSYNIRYYWYDADHNFISTNYIAGSGTITVPSTAHYIKIRSTGSNATYGNNVSINYPSTVTSYAPYSNICPISGWSQANVTRTGKNLFDQDTVYTDYKQSDGSFLASGATFLNIKTYIPRALIGVEVTFSAKITIPSGSSIDSPRVRANVNGTNNNGSYTASSSYTSSVTFIPTSTSDYIGINYSSGGSGNVQVTDFQLEFGSTPTSYVPYQGQSVTISLGDTCYGGYIDVLAGMMTVDKKFVTLDGSETWGNYSANYGAYRLTLEDANVDGKPNEQLLSSMFMGCSYRGQMTEDYHVGYMLTYNNKTDKTWIFFTTDITDKEDWLDWLDTNRPQLVYPLAQPVTIPLSPSTLSTLKGQNNIWADCGQCNVEYRADTKMFIENEIKAQTDGIRLMLNPNIESEMKSTTTYASGDIIIVGNDFLKADQTISAGETLTIGTNCSKTTMAEWVRSLL